jgi:hypothetical protein
MTAAAAGFSSIPAKTTPAANVRWNLAAIVPKLNAIMGGKDRPMPEFYLVFDSDDTFKRYANDLRYLV